MIRMSIINGFFTGALSVVLLSIPGVDITTWQFWAGEAVAFGILINSMID